VLIMVGNVVIQIRKLDAPCASYAFSDPYGVRQYTGSIEVSATEDRIVDSAFTLMGRARREGAVLEQMTLPRRHGGLGLRRISPLEGQAAFVSGAAQTEYAMSSGPAEFRPFQGPSGDKLRLMWEGLHDAGGGLWTPGERAVDDNSLRTMVSAQRTYSRHEAAQRYAALLASCDAATIPGKRMLARLRSCACQASAAWLTALPTARALELKDEEFRAAMQHRLGISPLPPNAVGLQCRCATVTAAEDGDHAMVCTAVQGKATMRHDILSRILRRVVHRAGVASTLEPPLRRLPGLEAGATATGEGFSRLGARGDVLVALESGMTVVDVSVTHPPGVALRAASAATDGAAAARRDAEKRRTYNRLAPNGYPLVPFSVETYGRLGKPAVVFLGMLGAEAMAGGDVSKSGFVAAALQELSVGLCKGNYLMHRASLGVLAGVAGRGLRPGADRPVEDVCD
jgi:hypothetical protein